MIGAATLGRSSRVMIRRFPAPAAPAATTNSFSRSDRIWPRTMRAMYGQLNNPITRLTRSSPGLISPPRQPLARSPQADTSPSEISRMGSESTMSIVREMTVSTLPLKKPDISPAGTPIATAIPVAT
jgi:hypothetical protein